ncbi:Transcriptional adapter 2-alpha [Seminavis robusta]|uniref:Transcriptional adapter 2-alpha n=1 Tax=Seminavis robusta TaxID=568900 RepID=A0A9N8DST7_9STRA|nr:Transcriptional adapter 2-alpha [Seminavis robusta]|eukprot:Sro345_g122560.1 Transcriptional adapter 2-alpha (833) ;mRNA; r:65446-68027
MPPSKRRKTNKAGSRSNSRATTPVPPSRPESPVPNNETLNPPLVLASAKRRGVFECDYCHSDISQHCRIRCAHCPDFDLCTECFLTTDHTTAVARLKASHDAKTAVDNLSSSEPQYGGGKKSPGASSWASGSGAINHNDSHGYRVCDSTRYPMFPPPRGIRPARAFGIADTPASNNNNNGTTSTSKVNFSEETLAKDEETKKKEDTAMDIVDSPQKPKKDTENLEGASTPGPLAQDAMQMNLPDDPKLVWTVEEDLRLLDAIEENGLGNWLDISEAISGNGSVGKSPKRCMERYFDDFLGRYGHILPPYTLVAAEDAPAEEKIPGDGGGDGKADVAPLEAAGTPGSVSSGTKDMDPTRLSKRRHSIMVRTNTSTSNQSLNRFNKILKPAPTDSLPEYQVVLKAFPNPLVPKREIPVVRGQEVLRDQSARAEHAFVKLISTQKEDEAAATRKLWKETKLNTPGGPTVLPERPDDVVQAPGSQLAGFMPRRGDFDIEYENDAEQALADMEFLPGESDADKLLKLQVLQIYNEKLREREKRKAFIVERRLHDYRHNQKVDESLPRDERDLVRRMRLVERFHDPDEHKKFLEDVLKAKALRKEIAKLQMYRRIGITSEVEAERYELDKARRIFHKTAVLKEAALQGEDKIASTAASGDTTATASGGTPGKKAEPPAEEKTLLWKGYNYNNRDRRRSLGSQDGANAGSDIVQMQESSKEATGEESKEGAASSDSKETSSTGNNTGSQGFAIETMEGFKFLTRKEVELCRRLELPPKLYTEVKKVLIHESFNMGLVDSDDSVSRRTIVQIDVEKKGAVVDFFVRAGWLKGTSSVSSST